MKEWVSLPLRISIGAMFCAHGLQKAFGLFGGQGIEGVAKFVESLGFAPPLLWAYIVAYIELLGGIALIIGLGTRIASGLLIPVMLVALFKVHLVKGFFMSNGGFEYTFVILGALIALLISGTGKLGITKRL